MLQLVRTGICKKLNSLPFFTNKTRSYYSTPTFKRCSFFHNYSTEYHTIRTSTTMATANNGTDEQGLPKRQKLSSPLIGTHNGHFHADEALAVFLLRLLPAYHKSSLVRTRDVAILKTCHTVVDVGGEYDPERNRYDHHQREFKTTFPGHSTKLSSAGLVYMHFGKAIIASQTGLDEASPDAEVLYQKIYTDFVEAFDANDNGVSAYDEAAVRTAGIAKRFEDSRFSIASVVNRYNHFSDPGEPVSELAKEGQQIEDERFQYASTFTGQQFLLELKDTHQSWLPARAVVRYEFERRFQHHASGNILVLPHRSGGLPWADHLYEAEDEEGDGEKKVLYVLFPENGEPESKWRIRAVSVARGSFTNRKDLPDAWKGLRDEELSRVSGVPGGVFVHASGFIGGNVTFEGALEMGRKAVDL